jgi:hypothetical protein
MIMNFSITADSFVERLEEHRERVMENAKRLVEAFPEYKTLLDQVKEHDESKFEEPEFTPYVHIHHMYQTRGTENEYQIPEDIDHVNATEHHVRNNEHHPEYWVEDQEKPFVNPGDRDKRITLLDATEMPDLAIAEMCCDWMAVAQERKTNVYEWAKSVIDIRWKFSEDQKNLIYTFLDELTMDEFDESMIGDPFSKRI